MRDARAGSAVGAGAGADFAPPDTVTRDEIFDVIKTNMQVVIQGARDKETTQQHSMRDFGADSLEMVEVVSRSMKQCRRKVKRTDLAQAKNLGDLLTLLENAPEVGGVTV